MFMFAGITASCQKTEEEVFNFYNIDKNATFVEFTITNKGKEAGMMYEIMYNSGTGWSIEKIFMEKYKIMAGESRLIRWIFNPNFPKPTRVEVKVYLTRY